MKKTIVLIIAMVAVISVIFSGCAGNKSGEEESTTDIAVASDILKTVSDKSERKTQGNLIVKSKIDNGGNVNVNYYDNSNNMVEQFIWDANGSEQLSHSVFTYNSNGDITSQESFDKSGMTISKTDTQYDNENNISKKTVEEYENNLLTKSTNYDAGGTVTDYSIRTYDKNNKPQKLETYSADGKLTEYSIYEFNDEGRQTKFSVYSADDKLTKYTVFKYSDKGLLMREDYFDAEGKLQTYFTMDYDENNQPKSYTYYKADGTVINQSSFESTTSAS